MWILDIYLVNFSGWVGVHVVTSCAATCAINYLLLAMSSDDGDVLAEVFSAPEYDSGSERDADDKDADNDSDEVNDAAVQAWKGVFARPLSAKVARKRKSGGVLKKDGKPKRARPTSSGQKANLPDPKFILTRIKELSDVERVWFERVALGARGLPVLFCKACKEEVSYKAGAPLQHCKCSKHLAAKAANVEQIAKVESLQKHLLAADAEAEADGIQPAGATLTTEIRVSARTNLVPHPSSLTLERRCSVPAFWR
jgi:hypothetical protein